MKPGQRVIAALRKMIASGELKSGERIAEIQTAETLGVSRMPVRTALRALEHEGLVVKLGQRGYAARGASSADVRGAIEVRGVLEGLAARQACERGPSARARKILQECLESGDALFSKGVLAEGDLDRYHEMNLRFHAAIVDASGNAAIGAALARNNSLPFAGAAALALDWNDVGEFEHLSVAHQQHHAVVAALDRGDPDAAERIMRDHALAAMRNPNVFGATGADAVARWPVSRD